MILFARDAKCGTRLLVSDATAGKDRFDNPAAASDPKPQAVPRNQLRRELKEDVDMIGLDGVAKFYCGNRKSID